MRYVKVHFSPADRTVQAHPGENLLRLAQRSGVHIDSSCGGNGSCHQCRIKIIEGRFPEWLMQSKRAHFVTQESAPVEVFEADGVDEYFLACRGCVMGDLVVEAVPRVKQKRTVVRKTLTGHQLKVDRPDLPGARYGAAVDMGSTTAAGYLVDFATGEISAQTSRESSMIRFGGDILTRVSHTERYADGLATLTRIARADLDAVLAVLQKRADAPIATVSVCGNSVMQSFVMGWPVLGLGVHPFEPVSNAPQRLKGRELGLASVADAEIYVLPIEAGFVGGDNVAAILATGLHRARSSCMLLDIGTNGEIVVGDRNGLWCASTPTGPAFEGGEIAFGMRAAPGAIDSLEITPASPRMILTTIGNSEPVGICGSGIIDCVYQFHMAGIAHADGAFAESRTMRTRADGIKEVVIVGPGVPAMTPTGVVWETAQSITFTQKDFREVQLAKGALATGAELLLRKAGIVRPERTIIAGGFGSYIKIESAMGIGLIDEQPPEAVEVAGNAAGLGAAMICASLDARAQAEQIARMTTHIALPDEADFADLLMKHVGLPER